MYPQTYFLVQSVLAEMEARNRNLSEVWEDLARLNFDPGRIIVEGNGNPTDVFHISTNYTMISRAWSTCDHDPNVLFIDALNVAGSRLRISGRVGFSVQVAYDGSSRDIIEDHGSWKEIISPELRALEDYLFAKGEKELIYTYRSVKEIKR